MMNARTERINAVLNKVKEQMAEKNAQQEKLAGELSDKIRELDELRVRFEDSTEALRTVANLFSASVWKILPQKIKTYFEDYRSN